MAILKDKQMIVRSGIGGIKEVIEPLLSIFSDAINERATDIHLDPYDEGKHVRYRVDGVIHEKTPVPTAMRKRLLNQVKVLIDVDIDKSFVPDEGYTSLETDGNQYDMRVTIVPIGDREAIHFRFLSSNQTLQEFDNIGMREGHVEIVRGLVEAPYGMILVAGGTGSGKTTTLYSLANMLKLKNLIVTSIEDPVEFRLPHVRQLEVNEKHGFTMYEGLRVILRMDPDVIVIGEIRDKQSAATATRAGLSGQLVMASIHARNPSMAVDALNNMDVPRYVIGGALRLIIQQNLVLRVCQSCAREVALTAEDRALFDLHQVPTPATIHEAVGCKVCKEYGHKGRIAIFELTPIDRSLGQEIAAGIETKALSSRFKEARRSTLIQDLLYKVADGDVSLDVAKSFIKSLGER
jgi:type II secretory ATPase GspE/PulE/Tfp pilus assembly ATPase PilB-like protein